MKPRGRLGSNSMCKARFFDSATWRKFRSTVSRSMAKLSSSTSTVTVPDSIFDRSRMSLMSVSRSEPAEWMFRAKSTCLALRLPVAFSANCWPRMRIEFSGVRSSCDMLARNSDLYFEVSANSAAFSSRARRACSTSLFFRSTSTFCSASWRALVASSSLVCCSSFCCVCNSTVSCCDCFKQAFGAHRRFDGVQHHADAIASVAPGMSGAWRGRHAAKPAR